MITHALKLTLRSMLRHKSSFFINLIGLSTGLACALLIFLWVRDEWSIDQFHQKEERLFQVMEHQQYAEGIETFSSTPGLLAETLAEEVPEVEYAATVLWPNRFTLSVGEKNLKAEGHYVGADFLQIFSFPLLQGQPRQVLKGNNNIVITKGLAEKLFGSAEGAMGRAVEVQHKESFTVSGVLENIPSNSTFQFEFLLPYEKFKQENPWIKNWDSNSPPTYLTLVEGADAEAVSAKIAGFVKARVEDSNVTLFLKRYSERYLYSRYENGRQVGGRIEYVRLFSIIAVFILIIACINFMNLSTARASLRVKEIGVKKAVGAGRGMLIRQFLSEASLLAFFSLLVALVLVRVLLPSFNLITDKEIALSWNPVLLGGFLGITLLTGLVAGSYPALYLSAFKPAAVLKGELRSSAGELWARRGLVVFQFTLSVVLIVAVFFVYRQVRYVQSQNLGYDKDHLVYFGIDGRLEDHIEAFLEGAGQLPGVASITTVGHNLVGQQNNTSGLEWQGKNPEDLILFEHVQGRHRMLETFGLELAAGRDFSPQYGADTSKMIINETAAKIMGMKDPLGQKIRLWGQYDMEIIGVVKDFHFQSLHEPMGPLFFRLAPENTWNVMARLDSGREKEALDQLRSFYERFNPGFSFDYKFVEEEYALQYAAEQRVSSLSKYFAGFAILISCLGLFGLATFTADRKKKEIGIRKVLGASVWNLVLMLTGDFTRLVLAALVIGLPIAYLLVGRWLDRFAYRIELNALFFLLAGLLVLLIAWATVGAQAYRSAVVNPKDCLRSE